MKESITKGWVEMSKLSQEERLLKMLRAAGNKGVPNYEFPKNQILRYSARIGDLRNDGHNIYCEREYLPNGRASGVFRYYLNEETEKKRWWQR